jgi:hypothetical protein
LIKPPLCLPAVPTKKTHFQLPGSQLTDSALYLFDQAGVAAGRTDLSSSTLSMFVVQFQLHPVFKASRLARHPPPERKRDFP